MESNEPLKRSLIMMHLLQREFLPYWARYYNNISTYCSFYDHTTILLAIASVFGGVGGGPAASGSPKDGESLKNGYMD